MKKVKLSLFLQAGALTALPQASRQVQEKAGLVKTGLRPVYPHDAECLEVKSFFADQTRYDGSFRVKWANHGYHGGFDISASIGTPLKDVPIPYKTTAGKVVPEGTRLIWPFMCKAR